MNISSNAPWRMLLVAVALILVGCSERSDKAPVEKQAREIPRAAAIARGKIEVEGGLVVLSPASAGVVTALKAREGDRVQRGQVLLTQANELASAAVSVAKSELRLARAKVQAAEARLPELRRTAERYARAARAGAAQPQLAQEAQQRLRAAQSDVTVANAESDVAQRRLEQAQAVARQLDLRAPEDGVVVGVATQQGAWLETGAAALTLLPTRPLMVRAELNAAYVSAVREGMRAMVTSDEDSAGARPLPPATLVRINPIYGNGRLQDDTQRGPVHVVECILEFDGQAQALVGQNVRVTFYE